jgi:primosomal protein N' (replication factor Y)
LSKGLDFNNVSVVGIISADGMLNYPDFRYPPFYRLIRIVFKDRNEQKVEAASSLFTNMLKGSLKERVLGPNKPVISKIQRYHIREILLKLEINLSPQQAESLLRNEQEFKYVVVYFDVDEM